MAEQKEPRSIVKMINIIDAHGALCIAKFINFSEIGEINLISSIMEHYQNAQKWKPLSAWVSEGNIDMVEYLLDNGAEIDKESDLIELAIKEGHQDIVNSLIFRGVWISPRHVDMALQRKYVEMTKFFIEMGADVTRCSNVALIRAMETGDLQLVRMLIENGLSIRRQAGFVMTQAAALGYMDIAEYLRDLIKEELVQRDLKYDWAAVGRAVEGNCLVGLKWLVEDLGIDIEIMRGDLMSDAENAGHTEMAAYLKALAPPAGV
jgi:ankyrin repeat protein